MARAFDIVGFDLDGTLLDTSASLTRAVNFTLAQAGRPPLHIDEVRPMIGGGAKRMLEKGLESSGGYDPEEMKQLYPQLLSFYQDNISEGSAPYPGLLEALDALAVQGTNLAVVTNKFERFALKLLEELGLIDRFATVIGGDTMGKGNAKPSAMPIREMIARCGGGTAVFLGDSIYDTLAAKNAGIPSIAVSFGFLMGPVEDLAADAVIDHYDELLPTLDRMAAAVA
ncbi:HAD-IA family hydrolase [Sphingomonas sp.]|jgi:phosphoglycolate phosphatase|uniref:HAD-IA family hydrolase n=1 Tax=Sphingomonas sp. TaxID=28214 RepID=UPI002DF5EAED|nr:HAD-IA family hydrolase [Sphingomonas sp.]HEV2569117.1 HAD-IA family hydrolase [Sphingomonas sp.]